MGRFAHFSEDETVWDLIVEMKARHYRSYDAVIDEMTTQIQQFFYCSFENRKDPPRFEGLDGLRLKLVRPKLLVGLSGGLDSTLVTYLACKAVGIEQVLPVTMPAHPDDESVALAAIVREALGFDEVDAPYVIPIESIVKEHMKVMTRLEAVQVRLADHHHDQSFEQKMRSGNFASRVRIDVLYDLQQAIRGRILGTMNRPKHCQGYSTKYGEPMSYDLGVLNDCYKADIREMALRLGIPQAILDAAPSTGYFAGQTHEGELGATIEEQDVFSYLLFEKRLDPETVVREYGANRQFAQIMKHRFRVSAHKRALNARQQHVYLSRVPLM